MLDLLLRASPDALVLSFSIHGDEAGRYPFVPRFATGGDERQRASLSQAATGNPAVIVRQDLRAIARADAGAHVVLALPGNVDAAAFLAEPRQNPWAGLRCRTTMTWHRSRSASIPAGC
ncbi:hypothetical protein [Streptomyces sp. NBRC 110028]|uniref:hypothetical protein n=1 Tax=Streptomyces sp. NBRC 110028 TaxID=1621260 RepID=UPI0006E3F962|nr:hypothetical protein [Streptomyces sp. NBRC 110028]